MAKDLRQQLAETARRRVSAEANAKHLNEEEQKLVAEAWRQHIPPGEIAELADRSPAHIRKLRPEDVPPLRLGGNAAPRRRRSAKKTPPPG